jgi:hypothetical protein
VRCAASGVALSAGIGSVLISRKRFTRSGSFNAPMSAAESLCTIAGGVPRGANTPCQTASSKPLRPASSAGGRSGSEGRRGAGEIQPGSHTREIPRRRAFEGHSHVSSRRPDCVAGHVGLELRNVVAKYLFEMPHGFPGIRPNSCRRDCSRLSCGVRDTQPGPSPGSQQHVAG